jgi:hypothetical protein
MLTSYIYGFAFGQTYKFSPDIQWVQERTGGKGPKHPQAQ